MAASIYATPPPDLSSEDTALSDLSNTSTTTNKTTVVETPATSATTTTQSTTSIKTKLLNQNYYLNTTEDITITSATTTTTTSATSAAAASSKQVSAASSLKNQQQQKSTNSDVLNDNNNPPSQSSSIPPPIMGSSRNANDDPESTTTTTTPRNTTTTAMAAVAAAANAAMQLQFIEAINDAAKKRRKQIQPNRMEGKLETNNHIGHSGEQSTESKRTENSEQRVSSADSSTTIDYEDKLSKMFLPKSMEKLKETFELLQQQQQHKQHPENISTHSIQKNFNAAQEELQATLAYEQSEHNSNPYHTFCRECGENFENEFKLSLHMLHEHNPNSDMANQQHLSPLDILQSVRVKMERPDCDSPSSNHNSDAGNDHNAMSATQQHMLANGKDHMTASWMANAGNMPPMGFSFPPEAAAAAALQAGSYLPLLGMTGFPGVDGLNRPPLRIFNPEAFCELCNKEFCNKYFLKTHKANKHGIYDPMTDGAGASAPVNGSQQCQQSQAQNMNAMNQMFQLQMQQQQQHLQQQQQHMQMELQQQQQQQQQNQKENLKKEMEASSNPAAQSQQLTPPAPQMVYCDICSKRFTNAFAMRRHKSKVHEQNSNAQRNSPPTDTSSEANKNDGHSEPSSNENVKQFQMPDGFRQDFALEQEDVSFTPQPRKLSPQFQQQAREANFAHDKLKNLGVLNPEAFCELCCKEYCNKYFLRTHKWKRHGIFLPAEENAEPNSQKFPHSWPFMNMPGMAPMNLMMAQRMMGICPEQTFEDVFQQQSQQQQQQPMSKRIKLEISDKEEEHNSQENQENRGDNNQAHSIPSTPEPQQKILTDSQQLNAANSAEATMGLQNLQKLQSMIQQLNDLNGKRPVACHLCGREMENHYALQAHIMSEHGNTLDPAAIAAINFPPPSSAAAAQIMLQQQALLKQSPNGSPGSLLPPLMAGMPGEMRCTPCDRDFNNLPEFQKHIAEVHLLSATESPLREGFATPERPINANLGQGGARPPYTITPTSSYCEICNKELCNKYFMKTHMQRMHGIEIENGSQIGGVVCNICNKELCSKYFLRVHKHNTHGIIEDGSPLPQPRQNGLKLELALQQQILEGEAMNRNLSASPFGSGGSEGKNDSSPSYQEICTLCSRHFRNAKWLKSHLLSDHGAAGSEKVRELEQQFGSLSKPSSPTLKIPNGSTPSVGSASTPNGAAGNTTPANVPSPAQLAQALQNLNAQHLLQHPEQTSPRLKEYQCSMCPFTTPYYAFLFIHERTHSIINNNEDNAAEEAEAVQDEQPPQKRKRSEKLKSSNDRQTSMEIDEEQQFSNAMQNPNEIITLDQEEEPDIKPDISMSEFKSSLVENPFASKDIKPAPPSTSPPAAAKNLQSRLTPTEYESPNSNHDTQAEASTGLRTIACSPAFSFHQQLLQEVANQTGKIASFAVPTTKEFSNNAPQMQAFVLEAATNVDGDDSDAADISNRFVPAIIYLPVTERLTGSLKLSFNLTPV